MKLIIGYIIHAVLGWFSARRDHAKKIALKVRNKQLEKENEILDMQNTDDITDVSGARRLFALLRNKSRK